MGDSEMDWQHIGDGELERRLRAYAGVRLSPDAWASVRMRADVIERGRTLREEQARRGVAWTIRFRRSLLLGLVAVLAVMAGGSAALAATPGGPLYGTRIAIESALLPGSGDARSDAQLGQLGERVDEAGANADPAAVGAALAEYEREVGVALADAGTDADRLARLRAVLANHIDVLRALVKTNPSAAAAIENAIEESSKAITKIEARQHADHPERTPPPHDPKTPDHP
jgi:hypothetical protein